MSKLGSDWDEWFDKHLPELNTEERIKTKRFINVSLILMSIAVIIYAAIVEGIPFLTPPLPAPETQNIVQIPQFVNFNDCRVDEDCWNKVLDSFLDEIYKDSNDGYFDCDDWRFGCSEYSNVGFIDLQNALENIADEELKERVVMNFDKKLMAIDENQRTPIIQKINYQSGYFRRLLINSLSK